MEKKDKIILFSLLLGTFMMALDATIVSVAIPSIAAAMNEAGHDTTNISWILLIYTLMLCCFILLWAKLGSNRGFKKIFMAGIAIFSISSLAIGLCGLNVSIGLTAIIILRAVQGLGAGMSMAVSLAMVSSYLPAEIKGSSIAAVTLAASVGTAFGPAIGGLLTAIHWSYIFYINVPIGIICLILCWKFMNVEEKLPAEKNTIDYVGATLLFIMMFALIFYLNRGDEIGWLSDKAIALLVVMFVAAGLVAWWEGRVKDPLMSMRLLKEPNILKSNLAATFMFMAMAGCYLLLPYYLGAGLDHPGIFGAKEYSTVEYGLILIANSVGMMAAGPIVGRVSDKTGKNRIFIVAGALIAALGFFLMMRFEQDTELWYILVSLFVMGAGMGMGIVGTTNLAFCFIRPDEDGQLSGLTNTFRQAGSSAGVAILEAVFSAGLVFSFAGVDLTPGLKHAFFVGLLFVFIAFVLGMSCKDKKDCPDA